MNEDRDVYRLSMVDEKLKRLRELRAEAENLLREIVKLTDAVVTSPQAQRQRTKPLRQTSVASWAYRVLSYEGRPMHVRDIQRVIERERGPIQRTTLVSSVARYSKRADTFVRVDENVYGLLEWSSTNGVDD